LYQRIVVRTEYPRIIPLDHISLSKINTQGTWHTNDALESKLIRPPKSIALRHKPVQRNIFLMQSDDFRKKTESLMQQNQ
jgi:hypothetical protein